MRGPVFVPRYNQVNALSLACRTGLKECQDLVSGWFRDWMVTGHNRYIRARPFAQLLSNVCADPGNLMNPFSIHANLRLTVYCNAIAAGGQDEWDFAWRQFQSMTVATEAEKLRSALSCTKQQWLINRYAHTLGKAR